MIHEKLSNELIGIFYHVYSNLGHGFLEKVYQNSMYIELSNRNYQVETNKMMKVYYKGREVGLYYADLVVNDTIIIELKAHEQITPRDEAQLLNYLRATEIELGLLLNFGLKPQFTRKIFSNKFKKLG
ncbi:MAG: GxxExxY protein [Saprospiraceae bacterium]